MLSSQQVCYKRPCRYTDTYKEMKSDAYILAYPQIKLANSFDQKECFPISLIYFLSQPNL